MSTDLKHCAHIGDAVWDLFVREIIIEHAKNQKQLHSLTVRFVNANFQAKMIRELEEYLIPDELEFAKRARNLPLGVNKKSDPAAHSNATAFEALIGHFYLNDKTRLQEILGILKDKIKP